MLRLQEKFKSIADAMSKKSFNKNASFAIPGVFLQIFTIIVFSVLSAQAVDFRASLLLKEDGSATVRGNLEAAFSPLNPRNFYFRLDPDRARFRISNLKLFDEKGVPLRIKELIPGEYITEYPFSHFEYEIVLSASNLLPSAHKSSANADFAIIYTDDLLPRLELRSRPVSFELTLSAPQGYQCFSVNSAKRGFVFEDLEKGVVICGKNIKSQSFQIGGLVTTILTTGERDFSETDAKEMITEILEFYSQRFGRLPEGNIMVSILPLSTGKRNGYWEGETRGRAVTIVSSEMPFRSQSLQRLHEQLRHELFHLWIPNGIRLSGDYSIFYEGLATYSSLRAGVALRRIRFEDMLSTLSAAAAAADAETARDFSLPKKPSYAVGLAAAFAADIRLLNRTFGRRGLLDEVSEIYRKYSKDPNAVNGNELFGNIYGINMSQIKTELSAAINSAGLEFSGGRLRVVNKPNSRQKAILRKIGYNSF